MTIAIALMSGPFDLFDGHSNKQNGLHTHFAHQCNICYGHMVTQSLGVNEPFDFSEFP